MHNFKSMQIAEFRELLPKLSKQELSNLLSMQDANVANNKEMLDATIEYLLDKDPEMLISHLDSNFWINYAKNDKTIDVGLWLCKAGLGDKVFSEEQLVELVKDKNFTSNVFSTLPIDSKQKIVKKLMSVDVNAIDIDMVSNVIRNSYSSGGFDNFQIDNTKVGSKPTPKKQKFYNEVVLNNQSSYLQEYFDDSSKRQMFLENFDLLSALSINDRTTLFNSVNFENLSEIEQQNIAKLFYNGYVTNFDDNLFKNNDFVKKYLLETSVTDFRRMAKTIEFSHPHLSQDLIDLKDHQLDKIIMKDGKINNENYPIVNYKNGDKDDFWNVVVYRHFKTCPHDFYISTQLIQDSRATLDIDGRISKEGKNLLDSMARIVNIKEVENFTKSKLHYIKHKKLMSDLLGNIDLYNENVGKVNMSGLVDTCRDEFAKNMFAGLTDKTADGVKSKYIDGNRVYDITECEDIKLLIHSTNSGEFPEIKLGQEQLVSMSLLDNNHLHTFVRDPKFVFGYNSGQSNCVVHAYAGDGKTGFSRSAEEVLYEKITNVAPMYTDIETFMDETDEFAYNEIKIKASANAQRGSSQIMKPDFVLYQGEDLSSLPKYLVEFANEHNIDIFTINPQKVKKKNYANTLGNKMMSLPGARYLEM